MGADGGPDAGHRLFLSESAISKYTTSTFAKLGITDDTDTNRRVLAVLVYLNAPASLHPPRTLGL